MLIWGVLNLSDVLRSVVLSLQNLFSEFVLQNYILSHDMQPMKYAKMYVEKSSVQADLSTYVLLIDTAWLQLSDKSPYLLNSFML